MNSHSNVVYMLDRNHPLFNIASRRLRKFLDMTQAEFGKEIGVGGVTVGRYESQGESRIAPSEQVWAAIENLARKNNFPVNMDDLDLDKSLSELIPEPAEPVAVEDLRDAVNLIRSHLQQLGLRELTITAEQ